MNKKRQRSAAQNVALEKTAEVSSLPLWQWYTIPSIILSAIAWIFYFPSLHYSFQFDDVANITKYFHVRNNSFSALFFTGTRWISYWLNSVYYKFNKFDPFLYRVGNVTFHTITGVVLFLVLFFALRRYKNDSFFKKNAWLIAFFTAALFLLHPVQTQTVSYVIQGQLEGLAALFIMLMALFFILMTQYTGVSRIVCFICLFISALLSCGTKEIAILSPLLIMLIDWFFIAQADTRQLLQRLWIHTLLIVTVISSYIYFLKTQFFTDILNLKMVAYNNAGNIITPNATDAITPGLFFISQFKVILHYIGIFLWPFNISVEYDWKIVPSIFALDCILPFLILLLIGFFIVQTLRKDSTNTIAFGLIWFFVCILPRSSIIPSPELIVDYKTYTASIGLLLLLASTAVYAVQKLFEYASKKYEKLLVHQAQLLFICLLLLSLPVGFVTSERNKVWRSGSEFWLNIIENAPNKARAYNNYGVEISQNQQKYFEAIPFFKKAISLDSKYPDPYNNLAVAYSAIGQLDQATLISQYNVKQNPYCPEAYNNLASFLLQKKQYDQAEKMLKKSLALRPHYGKAYFNLGRVYLEQGRTEYACNFFKKACMEADFDNDLGFTVYGQTCAKLEKFSEAIFAFNKALELAPHTPDAWLNLGNAYYLAHSFERARDVFRELTIKWPKFAQGWFNLAESYFALNDMQNAYDCYKYIEQKAGPLPQISLKIAGCLEKMNSQRA